MQSVIQDIRFSVRGLRKAWGFSVVAVAILALGIGATTTVFSIANAVVFRPMNNGASAEGDLVRLYSRNRVDGNWRDFSYPNYQDIRARPDVFSDLAAVNMDAVGLVDGDVTRRVYAAFVSSNYFPMLGVSMARGRAFTPVDDEPGAPPSVVLSHEYWVSRGADPSVIGQSITVGARRCTVVGVAPGGFTGTMVVVAPPVWLPLGQLDGLAFLGSDGASRRTVLLDRDTHQLNLIGRLAPGLTVASAAPRLDAIGRALEQAYPAENQHQTLIVRPNPRLAAGSRRPAETDPFATTVFFVLAMATVLLLVAALNLANMLLARGGLRHREMAIRLAVGASRWNVVRLLLVEASLLAFGGGLLGVAIAYGASQLVASTVMAVLPMLTIVFDPTPDARVLAATLGFCVFSTLVFGLGPALGLSRADVATALKDKSAGAASAPSRSRRFLRHGLVVSQIALSLVLLTAGGLFFFGALRASHANPGFALEGGVIATVDTSLVGYDEARTRAAFTRVLEHVRTLPGVVAASLAHTTPYGERNFDRYVQPSGAALRDPSVNAQYRVIGSDYFRALGMSMVQGREFRLAEETGATTTHPVIVDTEFARQMWPGQNAVGRQIQWADAPADGAPKVLYEIVGVATSLRVKLFDRAPRAHVYVPYGDNFQPAMMVHVHTASTDPQGEAAMVQAVAAGIRAVDGSLPVTSIRTLRGHRDTGLEVWFVSLAANVFAVFGVVALVMAGVGLYGVRAFLIGRRVREFGIRMAMGATSGDVMRLVMSEGARLVVAGLCLGLVLSAGVSQMLSAWVYGVRAFEPVVFVTTALLLTAVMLLACYVPARRATAVQPMSALRDD